MPTSTGLPKKGEVWELQVSVLGKLGPKLRAVILDRSRGDYWSLTVYVAGVGRKLWVDAPYHLKRGELRYVGDAAPDLRKKLGI